MTLFRTDSVFQVTGAAAVAAPKVRDILLHDVGGTTQVYALTDATGDGMVRLTIDDQGVITQEANQFQTPVGSTPIAEYTFFDRTDASGLAFANVEGVDYIVTYINYKVDILGVDSDGPTFFEINDDGTLTSDGTIERTGNSRSIDTLSIDGSTFMVEMGNGDLVVSEFSDFSLTLASQYTGLDDRSAFDVHTTGLVSDDPDAKSAPDTKGLFYLNDDNEVEYVSFSAPSFSRGGALPETKTSFSLLPKDLEVLTVGNKSFLITSSVLGGIRVFDVVDDGPFLPDVTLTDHLTTNNGSRAFAADQIVTFSLGGRGFVAAAGDELTVFEVSRTGDLYEMSSDTWTHNEVFDIEAIRDGNGFRIVVAGDTGVATFDFTPGPGLNIVGDDTNNVLIGDARDNRIEGRGGNDRLEGLVGEDGLFGGDGNDLIYGGSGSDDLFGGAGNDLLYGGSEDDQMSGDAGSDRAYGGAGRDDLSGGDGNDRLEGGSGRDTVIGDSGKDSLTGGGGNDNLYGGGGKDQLFGGGGKDQLSGGGGKDQLVGGGKADRVYGGGGKDKLDGNGGKDILDGGGGKDRLKGGGGKDQLTDGRGRDVLFGGAGADLFDFVKDNKRDVIRDWDSRDRINVGDWGPFIRFEDLTIKRQKDGDLIVSYRRESIEVDAKKPLTVSDLTADDFSFF